jgi:hypothetical protein
MLRRGIAFAPLQTHSPEEKTEVEIDQRNATLGVARWKK